MGAVVLSLDAELAWGFHDETPPAERIESGRDSWLQLVDLFDEYDVPATWAIIGHLFLDHCDGEHAGHPTPTDDWFERDPGGWATDDSLWFGGGLIDAVDNADVDHEIAGHTFSHVEFGHEDTTRDVAAAELRTNLEVADDRGFSLESLVFPRNNVGHRDVLAAYGIQAYRPRRPNPWYDRPGLRPVAKVVDAFVGGLSPPLVTPTVDDYGLVRIPASMYLFSFEGQMRSVAERLRGDPVVRQARRGIDKAARTDDVFHMWLHPNNLTSERDFDRMEAILSSVAERRANGDLTVRTMADIAAELETEDPPTRAPIGPR